MNTPANSDDRPRYAYRWGYDTETKEFMLKLDESAPHGQYRLESCGYARTFIAGHGHEIRIAALPDDAGGVSARLSFEGKEVATPWVKVRNSQIDFESVEAFINDAGITMVPALVAAVAKAAKRVGCFQSDDAAVRFFTRRLQNGK